MIVFKWLVAVGVLCCCSCGFFSQEDEVDEASAMDPRLVGRIASVSEKQGFVLIQSYGEWILGEGLLLSSVGDDGRTATLVASGERKGRYAAADYKAGAVKAGDFVYARQLAAELSPSAGLKEGDSGGASEVERVENAEPDGQ